MGYSFVRLLPKETGVRCITNLKRKAYRAVSQHFFRVSCLGC